MTYSNDYPLIRKGDIVVVEEGEYSSRYNIAVFKSLKYFDISEQYKIFESLKQEYRKKFGCLETYGTFLNWLEKQKFIKNFEFKEINFGYI